MNIKTIIFDLGGVCFSDNVQYFAMKMNDKYDILPQQVYNIFGGKLGTQYLKGEITLDAFWNEVKSQLHLEESVEELHNLWLSGLRPLSGTIDIIKELRKNGYETLFLSDSPTVSIEYRPPSKFSANLYFSCKHPLTCGIIVRYD